MTDIVKGMARTIWDVNAVRQNFDYDPETGVVRKLSRGRMMVCAALNNKGYVSTRLNGRYISGHTVAFILTTGRNPGHSIDHINGNRSDNRWSNLRECDQFQNMANRVGPQRNSKSGARGVSWRQWRANSGAWEAKIEHKGKTHHLGYFKTVAEALAVRERKAAELFGEFSGGHVKDAAAIRAAAGGGE